MSGIVKRFEATADRYFSSFSRPLLAFLVLLTLCIAHTLTGDAADPDMFARIAVGKLFIETGFTASDPFSFAPKKPVWVDHEWFAGVVFYYASQFGGDTGLLLLKITFVSFILLFLFLAARKETGTVAALTICGYSGLQSYYLWATTVRSQLFTYLFLAFLLFGISRFLNTRCLKALYLLPFCMLVWIQAHGGFVVGLGLFGIFCLWALYFYPAVRIKILLLGITNLAATLISPYGPLMYWQYILEAVTMPRPSITEWAPVDPLSGFALGLAIPIVLLTYGLKKKETIDNKDILIISFLIISLLYGIKHQRLAAIFCFVSATLGCRHIEVVLSSLKSHRLFLPIKRSYAVVLSLVFPLAIAFIGIKSYLFKHLNYYEFPVGPMLWLQFNAPPGKVLVDFNGGSYALWRGYPDFLVSMDGRYEELYTDSTLSLVTGALSYSTPEHKKSFKQLKPDYIVLDCRAFPDIADYGKEWFKKYDDGRFVLFTKGNLPEKFDIRDTGINALEENMWKRSSWKNSKKNE